MNDVRREKYQVMPALPAEDYEALKADIAARGVMVAIEVDEYGNILDGYNRTKVCSTPIASRTPCSLTLMKPVSVATSMNSWERSAMTLFGEPRGRPGPLAQGAWRGHIGIKPGRIYPRSPPDHSSDLPTTKDDIPKSSLPRQ
jgi:hypothetical protein